MVQIPCRRFPRAATSRSRGWRVDSRLAVSRFSCSRHLFATCVHLPPLSTDHRALRASQRGPCASRHFSCLLVRRPLFRLKSSARCSWSVCTCPSTWRHDSASAGNCWTCMVTIDQHVRGTPAVVCMARICREAGARVKENQFKQVAIDNTVVSALTVARGRRQGQAIHEAEQDKRRRYPDEVARRWIPSAVTFMRNLYKSLSVPRVLRRSTQLLFFQRWTALLACSIQRAYAASLLGKPLGTCACVNGPAVHLGDLDRLPCA